MTIERNKNEVTVPVVNKKMTKSGSMPTSPHDGDIWFNTSNTLVYTYNSPHNKWDAIGTNADSIAHIELKDAEAEENFSNAMSVVGRARDADVVKYDTTEKPQEFSISCASLPISEKPNLVSHISTLTDMEYFQRKVVQGLGIPSWNPPSTPEDGDIWVSTIGGRKFTFDTNADLWICDLGKGRKAFEIPTQPKLAATFNFNSYLGVSSCGTNEHNSEVESNYDAAMKWLD